MEMSIQKKRDSYLVRPRRKVLAGQVLSEKRDAQERQDRSKPLVHSDLLNERVK